MVGPRTTGLDRPVQLVRTGPSGPVESFWSDHGPPWSDQNGSAVGPMTRLVVEGSPAPFFDAANVCNLIVSCLS